MFYDTFLRLCNLRNIAPTVAAVEIGFQKSVVTRWKNGVTPRDANLRKVAEYFDVSVDYLLGNEEQKETSPAAMTEDEELQYVLEQYKNRPCLRMLFKVSDKATAKHVYQAAEQIEALTLLEEHKAADEQSAD